MAVRKGKIGVVLIDPHGAQFGDGSIGSYGVRLKELPVDARWARDDLGLHCVYQRNVYPRGARLGFPVGVDNATNTKLGPEADHWRVTDMATDTGLEVAVIIQDMIRWLVN